MTVNLLGGTAGHALAEPVTVVSITEWKAVYGTVEVRDWIPARARLGGTLGALTVAEGDRVVAGQELARIVDGKLDFQLAALAAQGKALAAQLANARADLGAWGRAFHGRGDHDAAGGCAADACRRAEGSDRHA